MTTTTPTPKTKAKKYDGPRHVCRVAMAPSKAQRAELIKRMQQARRWYNVVLKECLTRVKFIKSNRTYRKSVRLVGQLPE